MAYRFGHSMVRPSYRANFTGNAGGRSLRCCSREPDGTGEPSDLRGGFRSPRRFIGWQTFFRFPGFESDVRPNKRLDTKLSTPLFDLPLGAIAPGAPPTSLAARNLLRHLTWRLPSGQTIAAAMGAPVLSEAELADLRTVYAPFVGSTPLWFYVLREADILREWRRTSVRSAAASSLKCSSDCCRLDPDSFLNSQPGFTPSLGSVPGQLSDDGLPHLRGSGREAVRSLVRLCRTLTSWMWIAPAVVTGVGRSPPSGLDAMPSGTRSSMRP